MVLFKRRTHELDMVQGPLLRNIISFALPISISGIIQLLFNAADMAVVGKYAEQADLCLAAIGSNGPLINIMIQLFMGFSVGCNIVIAKSIGEGNRDKAARTAHTAIVLSLLCGILVMTVGLIFCRTFLNWLLVPSDVIDLAEEYMRIYFLGVPLLMLYNFGAAVMRATGDTKRPLFFLIVSGIVNVVLNVIFVKFLHWDVDGVATATCVSELISSVLVMIALFRTNGTCKIFLKKLRLYKKELGEILYVGVPAGIHSCMYSIANVIIQSSINSFGSIVMAGNSAGFNISNIVGTANYGFSSASTTFVSQNFGAKQYSRIRKITRTCMLCVFAVSTVASGIVMIFPSFFLSIFNSNPEVIEAGTHQLIFVAGFAVLDGMVVTMAGSIRGMGKSIQSMFISIIGICGIRLLYLFTVFSSFQTLDSLYAVYPVSWAVTLIANIIYYFIVLKKLPKNDGTLENYSV